MKIEDECLPYFDIILLTAFRVGIGPAFVKEIVKCRE